MHTCYRIWNIETVEIVTISFQRTSIGVTWESLWMDYQQTEKHWTQKGGGSVSKVLCEIFWPIERNRSQFERELWSWLWREIWRKFGSSLNNLSKIFKSTSLSYFVSRYHITYFEIYQFLWLTSLGPDIGNKLIRNNNRLVGVSCKTLIREAGV